MLNSFIYIILSFILLSSSIYPQEIAIITKQNGTIKYKKETSRSFKNKIFAILDNANFENRRKLCVHILRGVVLFYSNTYLKLIPFYVQM